jgi:hypothetical protein
MGTSGSVNRSIETSRRATVALTIVVSLSVAVAACGSRARLTKAQYQQRASSITEQFTDTLGKIFSSPELQNGASLKEAAKTIREGADAVRDVAGDLDDLNPPPEAESAHDQLVEGFRQFAQDLDGFADDAQAGSIAKIRAFDQAVTDGTLPSMVKIKKAIDDLTALGFQIGGTSASPSP